ncbi:hypothetical protein BDA99DRAFT_519032 [Phascolomyces articulosus]|uniref:Uncharacterized protein n=1 Tax=Phascolomyces articulosus TaxID=60185 RepID=A0AAD5JU29_9FUNG|nr:hypothetical protein BDA99DRAFT_519032 [Phascolomyces articulosus]
MPKLPSSTDTASNTTTNNKGKGKALQQPVSVATRVLPPRKRVSSLVPNSSTTTSNNNISPSNSSITSRSTSVSSSSSPSPQTNSSPPPPLPASSSSTSSSSSASSSPDEGPPPLPVSTNTATTTIRRLSERKSHLHPSYIAYSPRTDPTLYIDQLDTPMSDVREKKRRARPVTSFTELNVAPPVPSKRLRHHPRSRVHHAQQKYQERQAAAAAAAATAKAAAATLAYQQQQTQQPPSSTTTPTTSSLATTTSSAIAATTPIASSLSSSAAAAASTTAASRSSSAALQRRGPEYAYPRDALQVQLAQDLPVIDDKALNEKAKEKEYWRRQRRVFVRSRFITNEEATAIANSVYKSNPVGPQDRIVVTFQANIANFRSKWRKLLKELVKKLSINRSLVTAQDGGPFEREVRSKVDVAMLQKIWGHWLADPFVDEEAFYANRQSVASLTAVTVQAICVTLRYHYGLMKERDFRKQLDDLDKHTRNLELPDPLSSVQ